MANQTCGATLAVAVGGEFPVTFPYYFGPTVTMSSSGAAWVADTALAVIVGTPTTLSLGSTIKAPLSVTTYPVAAAGRVWGADVSLTAEVFSVPFPYTFPFVFDEGPVKMAYGQTFDVAQTVSTSPSGTVSHGQPIKASMPVTASFTAAMLQAFEVMAVSALSVTATPTASMTRNAGVDAQLHTVALPYRFPYTFPFRFWQPASVAWGAHAQAELAATLATTSAMIWDGGLFGHLTVTATPTAIVGFNQAINASLPILTAFPVHFGQGWLSDVAQNVTATTTSATTLGMGISAPLAITVITDVTLPDITSFWPFYSIS